MLVNRPPSDVIRRLVDPYRYDTIASWHLLPGVRRAATQTPLF